MYQNLLVLSKTLRNLSAHLVVLSAKVQDELALIESQKPPQYYTATSTTERAMLTTQSVAAAVAKMDSVGTPTEPDDVSNDAVEALPLVRCSNNSYIGVNTRALRKYCGIDLSSAKPFLCWLNDHKDEYVPNGKLIRRSTPAYTYDRPTLLQAFDDFKVWAESDNPVF